MKILVFGSTGHVATELKRRVPSGVALRALGRDAADLSDPASCAAAIRETDADGVINAAAYTAVDRAEAEEGLAWVINADAPGAMSQAATERGLPFVQISTDYVFDGSGTAPWMPDAPVHPLNAYGRSKLAGEDAVRAANGPHVILRTSWVFSAHGQNFVKTMLRLGAERAALKIVADQVGGPTPAAAIADACLRIAILLHDDPGLTGTYHFSGAPDVSWADFAREIFRQTDLSCNVADIPTVDYPTPALRPLNSRLDCRKTEAAFDLSRPDWRACLTEILREPGAHTA